MATVQTMRGELETSALGFTLMHEHLFLQSPALYDNYPQLFDREAEVAAAAAFCEEARAAGVDTIVDVTTVDLGRDIRLMAEVAERTELQVIAATGVHLRVPNYFRRRTPDRVVELYLHDINVGIAGTSIRAGALKIATEEYEPDDELQLRAIALAHRASGVPIMTHSNPFAGSGNDQQRVFAAEGVDLARVVIGHSGDSTDLDYLSGLMERGSTIGMDRFGSGLNATTEERIDTIAKLCARGYADRMVLSHDTSPHMQGVPREILDHALPEANFLTIPNVVVPGLRRLGVPEDQIEAMTTGNPRRIFEAQGAY